MDEEQEKRYRRQKTHIRAMKRVIERGTLYPSQHFVYNISRRNWIAIGHGSNSRDRGYPFMHERY